VYFTDRTDAGRRLAERLRQLDTDAQDVVVVGLPRGGVPVAAEVAQALAVPLDILVVRKLGVPFQPELGMGAIGEHDVRVINQEVLQHTRTTDKELGEVEARERAELERRVRRYRGDRPPVPLTGRTVVIVDDGIATGSTARAACLIARRQGAARIVLAVPIAPRGWEDEFHDVANELVCLDAPALFFGIGQFYDDFAQTADAEVSACLRRANTSADQAARGRPAPPAGAVTGVDPEVVVQAGAMALAGHLAVPGHATGVVLFAHGSGSSRHSPRNRYVAGALNHARLATLLFDLLTEDEELDRANVFDTPLLAGRLTDATRWLEGRPEVQGLPIGYFGASTGAAAALWAAAAPGSSVSAVVSRGGRPDLADARLPEVTAPTLLIVGGHDDLVLHLNREARAQLRCESELAVVPGATHLFEEPGALETVAELATDWFTQHLK
jgi:putative phosphoribosyl transferase